MHEIGVAFQMVFDPYNLWVMIGASLFGLFVGAVPGLTATMATALLVPVTFFMPPIPAIAAIVSATAMAIFAGDIPGCLLRMPGTPASAAYTDEAYAMTRKGQTELALGAGLVFSAIGGLFGTAVLIVSAPTLADIALRFSSFEYFWLVLLGLSCAIVITAERPLKGMVSLLIGLLVACVGLGNPAGFPRFTFGSIELMGGIGLIPMMIGMFAVSEIIRYAVDTNPPLQIVDQPIGNVFKGMWALTKRYPMQILRGNVLGTLVGALPGAGADIAAWMSYAISKKFSKEPEKFGTGHVEGIVESGSANNSALAGAWIPALVFGIPGDSITAIVIGVLYMKNMNPGPTLFTQNPQNIYAVYLLFIVANISDDSARLAVHQGRETNPSRTPQRADAADPAVLHRRHIRDQQYGVRRGRDAGGRPRRVCARGKWISKRAGDPRRRSGRDARGKLHLVDDQVRRQPARLLQPPDRRQPRRADALRVVPAAGDQAVAAACRRVRSIINVRRDVADWQRGSALGCTALTPSAATR